MIAGQSHITSIAVEQAADAVFAYMSNPEMLNRWSFGTWETERLSDGLTKGKSIFDGSETLVRIDADAARLSIDFHLGASPDRLVPRLVVRVVPGEHVGLSAPQSILTFIALRAEGLSD